MVWLIIGLFIAGGACLVYAYCTSVEEPQDYEDFPPGEWTDLIRYARAQGVPTEEIREFLNQKGPLRIPLDAARAYFAKDEK